MTTLAIEYLPITALTPYARNSRVHSEDQLQALANAFRTYGFNNPVAIDAEGGIIAGHGRVQAAALAGMDTVPCIRLTHLSEAQRRAYVIADNRLAEMGGWDMATLASEVEDLLMDVDAGLELGDLGIDDSAFQDLSAYLPDINPPMAPAQRQVTQAGNDDDTQPTADDYADKGIGATTANEGKAIQYPVILQLGKPVWQRWRKYSSKLGSDSAAITALLDLAEATAQEREA